jgi:hypothetical protein
MSAKFKKHLEEVYKLANDADKVWKGGSSNDNNSDSPETPNENNSDTPETPKENNSDSPETPNENNSDTTNSSDTSVKDNAELLPEEDYSVSVNPRHRNSNPVLWQYIHDYLTKNGPNQPDVSVGKVNSTASDSTDDYVPHEWTYELQEITGGKSPFVNGVFSVNKSIYDA